MNAQAPAASLDPSLTEGRFAGSTAFVAQLRLMLQHAATVGSQSIILCDTSFVDWPLNQATVAQSLNDWAKAGRSFTLLAQSFDAFARYHPRFVQWRQRFDHLITCRLAPRKHSGPFPSVIWTPQYVLHRFEGDAMEGVVSAEASRRFQLHEQLSEIAKTSRPGFAASTLGL